MGIHSVSLVRHWKNKICQCLLPVGLLCAKLANKCHFTKDIWKCKRISALAQMFIDLNVECEGWGLQRILCLLSFSSGMKCKFLLLLVSLKSPWLYHVNSICFKACVKSHFFSLQNNLVLFASPTKVNGSNSLSCTPLLCSNVSEVGQKHTTDL